MADPQLPRQQSPLVDRAAFPMPEWYDFFRDLLEVASEQTTADATIAELQAAVTALQNAEPDLGQILGNFSVEVQGLLGQAVALSLRGDVLDPGTTYYYGTNADGTKGWYPVGDTLLEGTGITLTVDPVTGEITVALADLADGGGGSFLLFTRDAQGRVSGTSAGDASDVPVDDAGWSQINGADVQAALDSTDTALAGKQPLDTTLTALAGQNWALNALPIGTGADTVSQVAFAANTFPARGSTGNLVAKTITDGSLSVLAGTAGAAFFHRGDGTAASELSGQFRVNLNTQALPFAYATAPLVLQAADDVDPSIFFHGFYSLGVIASGPQLSTRMARGTAASPAALQVGDHYGGMVAAGHNGSGYSGGGRLGFQARSTFTGSNAETRFFLQTAPSGSATPVSRVYVEPDGAFIVNPASASTETSANGKVQVWNNASGSVAPVARLANSQGSAGSGVGVSLDPGGNGYNVRDCLIEATNSGGNSITLVVKLANGATPAEVFRLSPLGHANAAATIRPGTYTVATLPASSLVAGMRATVTDATAPTYLGALTGGGSVTCGVIYNGSAWVAG